ncbi:hypothetical protein CLUG_03179 [Clavispora lusitaniae ATCC 42720]|uniref:candidapepsin n=1 Tax=Clavispora lusitaniae (strain ATCC 42720) TaxID=306902 RepID=C4Y3R6_CLAL4|nr:uncharacterized protein CLUG_03179 [Clavispora lusitaniae ATCC 42720]EEQ39053.1 hypothetical protein CLUG_03179 [Clavispora lusitaniae ATCC 42720]
MKFLSLVTLAAAVSGATVENLRREENKQETIVPLRLDFSVLRGSSPQDMAPGRGAALAKRDGQAELTIQNEQTYYSADLKLGSDHQEVSVLVDTGSSDLWIMASDVECYSSQSQSSSTKRSVGDHFGRRRALSEDDLAHALFQEQSDNTPDASQPLQDKRDTESMAFPDIASILESFTIIETNIPQPSGSSSPDVSGGSGGSGGYGGSNTCTSEGSFNTDSSDTFHMNSSAPDFAIQYADGTSARGFWGTDYVSIDTANVSDVSFAVVNETDSGFGVLGIGLPGLETTYSGTSGSYMYENFPMRLKSSGVIHKNVYSLYLNKADAQSGSVLFGGVDHAKYTGQLTTVPLVNIYSKYYKNPIRLDVALDSISFESTSSNITAYKGNLAALLDSGTTYSYLPTSVFERFINVVNAQSSSIGLYQLSCSYNTDSASVVFNFSGAQIKVPLSDLVMTYRNRCYLTVLEQSSSSSSSSSSSTPEYAVLGDNFLRNAYVVYNLDDYEISLAQAKYTDEEDIEIVSSSVPSAVKAGGYSSTSLSESSDTSEVTTLSSSSLKKSGAPRLAPWKEMGAALMVLLAFALM